jgi:hypothetical protein
MGGDLGTEKEEKEAGAQQQEADEGGSLPLPQRRLFATGLVLF